MSKHEGLFTPGGFTSPEEIRRRIGKTVSDEATAFGISQANLYKNPGRRIAAQIGGAFGAGLAGGYTSRGQADAAIAEQAQMQQAERAKQQASRKIIKDIDGYNVFADTGERVLKGSQKDVQVSQPVKDALLGKNISLKTATGDQIEAARQQVKADQLRWKQAGVQSPQLLDSLTKIQSMPINKERIKFVGVVENRLKSLEVLLENPDLTSDQWAQAIKNLSQLAGTSIKAASEVSRLENIGNALEVMTSAITGFVKGRPSIARINDIKALVADYRAKILDPSKQQISQSMLTLLQANGHSRDQSVIGIEALYAGTISSNSGGATYTADEIAAERARRSKL